MNWLIDTNVISETHKPQPSLAVIRWIEATPLSQIHTSAMNIAELVCGAGRMEDIVKRRRLDLWIAAVVRPWLAGRIVEIDENVLLRWLIISRQREKLRETSPGVDLLIAASALEHEMGVVTRDVTPFIYAGVPVLNPWTGERFNGA